MRTLLLIFCGVLSILFFTGCNTEPEVNNEKFIDYSGIYQHGPFQNGAFIKVTLLHDSSGRVLFYVYIDGGEPAAHEGQLYGEFQLEQRKGVFTARCEGAEISCRSRWVFSDNRVEISTINEENECGFGYGITVDGTFERISAERPEFFIDEAKTKVYFRETTPKEWGPCF